MNNYILTTSTFIKNLSIAKSLNENLSFKLKTLNTDFFKNLKAIKSLYLIDHSLVDYPSNTKKRFLAYYSLVNYNKKIKMFFYNRTTVNSCSVSDIWPCAEWLERESFDFFGLYYNNHPDLRRILTDYGFPSYALRKDFPVQGYFDILYSCSMKKIQFKEIEFQQSFRVFVKENPYLQS